MAHLHVTSRSTAAAHTGTECIILYLIDTQNRLELLDEHPFFLGYIISEQFL